MTITTDDTRSILTCSDHVRADTQQAWDLTIGDDPAGITVAEFTGDDAEDGVAGPRGRVAAQGTGANAAMLGVGGGMLALGGLARWAARRDPAGWVERRVSIQGDDEETRRRKSLFTLALILVIPFSVVWAALYFVYGEPLSALASMSYAVVTIAGMVLLFRFRNFALFCWTELALAFPVPVAQQLLLGGFVGSSAVILWSFLAALLAVMFVGAREAWWWFGAFVVAVVACSVLQPYVRVQNHLPTWLISAFFVLNIISVCAVSLVFLYSFARDRRKLRELEVSYLNQEMMLRQADKLATLRLELLPFSEQALRHFLFLERPEGMDLNDAEGLAAIEHAVPVTERRKSRLTCRSSEPSATSTGLSKRASATWRRRLARRTSSSAQAHRRPGASCSGGRSLRPSRTLMKRYAPSRRSLSKEKGLAVTGGTRTSAAFSRCWASISR